MGCGNSRDQVTQRKAAETKPENLEQVTTTHGDTYDFPGIAILAIIPGTQDLVDLTKQFLPNPLKVFKYAESTVIILDTNSVAKSISSA